MNHSDAVKAVLKYVGKSEAQLTAEFGFRSNRTISMRINRESARLDSILEILDACGYEMVAMPKKNPKLPEDTFVLRKEDYNL